MSCPKLQSSVSRGCCSSLTVPVRFEGLTMATSGSFIHVTNTMGRLGKVLFIFIIKLCVGAAPSFIYGSKTQQLSSLSIVLNFDYFSFSACIALSFSFCVSLSLSLSCLSIYSSYPFWPYLLM